MIHSHGCQKATSVLLLVGGLAHLFPQLYMWLSGLTGGKPWIQMIVGTLSVLVVLGHWFNMCKNCKKK